MIKEMMLEYTQLFPNKRKLKLIRSILAYKRMINFKVIVLVRTKLNTKHSWEKKYCDKKLIKYGVEVGNNCTIGENLKIEHINGIVIGNQAVIGNDCIIYQQVTIGQKNNKYPVIGNNVIMYPGCRIIGGITVGDNVVIGANAVVLTDVPSNTVVAGVPAKIVKNI